MKNIFTITLILLSLLLITGCADKEPQKGALPQKADKPSAEKKAPDAVSKSEEKVTAGIPIGYEYNPQGRRDPFKSLVAKETDDKKKGATPLEQDDIIAIRLTAIVWSGAQHHALITLPDGKSYTVRKGMRIGLDGGVVESITKDTVVVRQHIKDKKGTFKSKDFILRLRAEEQG